MEEVKAAAQTSRTLALREGDDCVLRNSCSEFTLNFVKAHISPLKS